MALTATLYRLHIALSDVDRGVYEQLDLRLAQHPSESTPYLLARALAYALCYEEGIAFTRGLAAAEEPALWVRDLTGSLTTWIDVGTPSAERLHKATKAAPRVIVFTHNDPELLQRAARERSVHRLEAIEAWALAPSFLAELAPRLSRVTRWELVRSGGHLYVTVDGATIEGALVPVPLGDGR